MLEIHQGIHQYYSRILALGGGTGYIRIAKLNPPQTHLALARSAKTLEIYALNSNTKLQEIIRNDKSSDAILGVEWTFDLEMVIVTR